MVLMVVLMPLSPLQFVRFSLVGIKVFSLPPILFSPLSPPAPLTFSIRHREKKKTFTVVVPSRIFLWKKNSRIVCIFLLLSVQFPLQKNKPSRDTQTLSESHETPPGGAAGGGAASCPWGRGFWSDSAAVLERRVFVCCDPLSCQRWRRHCDASFTFHVPSYYSKLKLFTVDFLRSEWLLSMFSHCNEIP